jgi:methylenetetrahydrofolate reductase (NADPH)
MVAHELSLAEELLAKSPSFSFEFFPPKDDAGEELLWRTIAELEPLHPTFVSVTYGAGGSTRERTVRITGRIAESTSLRPVGHLTLVGQSQGEIESVLKQYEAAGVRHVLALRGDPQGGAGTPWQSHPDGLDHAVDLVRLAHGMGGFCIGVAAFPEGHPDADSLDDDAQVLAAKASAGAEFAVTQLFFRTADYFALVERAHDFGCDIPIIPGIMPILNLAQVRRMAELSGSQLPEEILAQFRPLQGDKDAVRSLGIGLASQLCRELLDGGAPGLHFYTLNRSKATREIFESLKDRH